MITLVIITIIQNSLLICQHNVEVLWILYNINEKSQQLFKRLALSSYLENNRRSVEFGAVIFYCESLKVTLQNLLTKSKVLNLLMLS